jgi:hypothetical protein
LSRGLSLRNAFAFKRVTCAANGNGSSSPDDASGKDAQLRGGGLWLSTRDYLDLTAKVVTADVSSAMDVRFEARFDGLSQKEDANKKELSEKIGAVDKDLSEKSNATKKELSEKLDANKKELIEKMDANKKELDEKIGANKKELEELGKAVASLDSRTSTFMSLLLVTSILCAAKDSPIFTAAGALLGVTASRL